MLINIPNGLCKARSIVERACPNKNFSVWRRWGFWKKRKNSCIYVVVETYCSELINGSVIKDTSLRLNYIISYPLPSSEAQGRQVGTIEYSWWKVIETFTTNTLSSRLVAPGSPRMTVFLSSCLLWVHYRFTITCEHFDKLEIIRRRELFPTRPKYFKNPCQTIHA